MINIKDMIMDPKEIMFIKKKVYDCGSYFKYVIYIEFKNHGANDIIFDDEKKRDESFESLISALCIRSD